MLTDSTLSALVYLRPSPSSLARARQTLRTLSHLAFVISQFGGVTTTGTGATEFPQLKKAFYIALDFVGVGAGTGEAEKLVSDLIAGKLPSALGPTRSVTHALKQICIIPPKAVPRCSTPRRLTPSRALNSLFPPWRKGISERLCCLNVCRTREILSFVLQF
jgi:hypothetical protein